MLAGKFLIEKKGCIKMMPISAVGGRPQVLMILFAKSDTAAMKSGNIFLMLR